MKKEMKIALVAIGRLENEYAQEWVEHHLRMGFHHIFIADNNKGNEEHFESVLDYYIAYGFVTILDYRDGVSVQKQAYNEIYAQYSKEYDWFAFFDFDEYLDVRKGTLQSWLGHEKSDVVLVNWECYGDNGLVRKDIRPCWERFTEPLPHPLYVQYNDIAENDHVKSIIRGGLPSINFCRNPHTIGSVSPFRPYDPTAPTVLRHYITKTAEEWKQRSIRGSGSRSLPKWRKTYAGRFWKYNERTQEKEEIMKTEKTVAIVHYNTPELTEAAILSVRKHGGEDYQIVIFDNSDEKPWTKKMKGVRVIDNTKGQIVDFDKELAKYPNKNTKFGVAGKCVFGSDKHMMSIQALFDLLPEGFLLMDSDVLLKKDVDFMFMEDQCVVGHIQASYSSNNPYRIDRLVPMLCYINVPLCKACGINYWDPKRSWMLHGNTRNSWYDTGASFLEDIRSHKNGAHGKRIDIRPLMEHLKSGSWRNWRQAMSWIDEHKELWEMLAETYEEPEPNQEATQASVPAVEEKPVEQPKKKGGKPKKAKRTISKD